MRLVNLLLLLCIALLGVTFSCLNAQPVMLNYYVGNHAFPLSLILLVVLAAGVLLGLLVGIAMYVSVKGENFRLHRRVKLAEKEVANLRTIPLK
jgi:lipopolysaccharide assembly protein A